MRVIRNYLDLFSSLWIISVIRDIRVVGLLAYGSSIPMLRFVKVTTTAIPEGACNFQTQVPVPKSVPEELTKPDVVKTTPELEQAKVHKTARSATRTRITLVCVRVCFQEGKSTSSQA